MQNLHRATHNALFTADACRVDQRDRFSTQGASFDIDTHLTVLVADVAVDALPFFGRDFEVRPASPEVHPKRQRTPHAAPDPLTQKRIKPDRHGTGQKCPDPNVVPAQQIKPKFFLPRHPQYRPETHQVSNRGDGRQEDNDVTEFF